jgi:hypothetical protein
MVSEMQFLTLSSIPNFMGLLMWFIFVTCDLDTRSLYMAGNRFNSLFLVLQLS